MKTLKDYEYYRTELGVLYCGDCLEILPLIPDNSVDLVLTSPPYNKGLKNNGNDWGDVSYDIYSDNKNQNDYEKWQIEIINITLLKLNKGGSFFYNHKNILQKNRVITPYSWIIHSGNINNLKQEIIWDRKSSVCADIHHYYITTTEKIFWFIKNNYYINANKNENNNEILVFIPETNTEHPAPYPLKLAEYFINKHTHTHMILLLICFLVQEL